MTDLKISTEEYSPEDYSLEYGFAHVIESGGLTIQCCLEERENGRGFKKEIDSDDSGFDDGICGDVNEAAFKKYGKEECLKFLFNRMRKLGVKIV